MQVKVSRAGHSRNLTALAATCPHQAHLTLTYPARLSLFSAAPQGRRLSYPNAGKAWLIVVGVFQLFAVLMLTDVSSSPTQALARKNLARRLSASRSAASQRSPASAAPRCSSRTFKATGMEPQLAIGASAAIGLSVSLAGALAPAGRATARIGAAGQSATSMCRPRSRSCWERDGASRCRSCASPVVTRVGHELPVVSQFESWLSDGSVRKALFWVCAKKADLNLL